jgi:hypothetical protein
MKANFKAVVGYAIGWCLTIGFVVLLTFIFSFLGTIICAALAGMMVGAARLGRWPSLALSLVFPGVISTVLGMSRADLAPRQIVGLSVLCCGIFWVIYAAVFALVSQEGKEQKQRAERAAGSAIGRTKDQSQRLGRDAGMGSQAYSRSVPGVPATSPCRAFTLDALQGKWRAEANGSKTDRCRTLEIEQDRMVLSMTDTSGEVFVARAGLKVCAGSLLTLATSVEQGNLDPDAQVSI